MNEKILGNCLNSFRQSVECAQWIKATDIGAITLGRRLAAALDVAFDTGEIGDVAALTPKLMTVLQQLHLTTETRIQGKQEDHNDGTEYAAAYLRLITPQTPNKAKPRANSGGTNSGTGKRTGPAPTGVAKARSK
jgi:hypothetical protein